MKYSFQIDDSSRVLVLEDAWDVQEWFRTRLPRATIVRNPIVAAEALKGRLFDFVFLDHDVPCECGLNGQHVARHLAEMPDRLSIRVVVHSMNDRGAATILRILRGAGIPTTLSGFGDFGLNCADKPKCLGSLHDLGNMIVDSFNQLSPELRAQLRKELYENVTGKPYREDRMIELLDVDSLKIEDWGAVSISESRSRIERVRVAVPCKNCGQRIVPAEFNGVMSATVWTHTDKPFRYGAGRYCFDHPCELTAEPLVSGE